MNYGNLYIVATPIGNLQDITLRALETLKQSEAIFCEDTRHTKNLLANFDIKKKTFSLHQHSNESSYEKVLEQLALGDVSYVSDAGTPGISDPGGKLVEYVALRGIKVIPMPGASAITTALSISGFPTDKFLFLGFMPHKGKTKTFKQIEESKITVAFYESTHRIIKTLEQMKEFVGDRRIVVARELTKQFETVYRGTTPEVISELEDMYKGEFVVIVSSK